MCVPNGIPITYLFEMKGDYMTLLPELPRRLSLRSGHNLQRERRRMREAQRSRRRASVNDFRTIPRSEHAPTHSHTRDGPAHPREGESSGVKQRRYVRGGRCRQW